MSLRTRYRVHSPIVRTGHMTTYYQGQVFGESSVGPEYYNSGFQVMSDETHRWPPKGGGDCGGPMTSVSANVTASWGLGGTYTCYNPGGFFPKRYVGSLLPMCMPSSADNPLRSDYSPERALTEVHPVTAGALDAWGTKAIAATIPTNPNADVAVGAAELFREGLPKRIGSELLQDQVKWYRRAGSEYLNLEFGWKPLVNDLRDLSKSIMETEALLKQLARDSGKRTRRRMSFPEVRTTDVQSRSKNYLFLGNDPGSYDLMRQDDGNTTTTSVTKTWFSGSFSYHYDPADLTNVSRIATQARILYGLRLDPEVLWNLAPWSWLADWFVDVGPVLHNLSMFGQDGLVLNYGYIMQQRDDVTTDNMRNVYTFGGPSGNLSSSFSLVSKRRMPATPFGFGVSFEGFTARQTAILGALGLTRRPG